MLGIARGVRLTLAEASTTTGDDNSLWSAIWATGHVMVGKSQVDGHPPLLR